MTHHKHKSIPTSGKYKEVFKWVAIILVILLLFWLFIAEDIGAYIGWGND